MPTVTPISFAWTLGAGAYNAYPPYVNLTGNRLTVRGYEVSVPDAFDNRGYWKPGETVSVELPDEALREMQAALSEAHPPETVERVARALLELASEVATVPMPGEAVQRLTPLLANAQAALKALGERQP